MTEIIKFVTSLDAFKNKTALYEVNKDENTITIYEATKLQQLLIDEARKHLELQRRSRIYYRLTSLKGMALYLIGSFVLLLASIIIPYSVGILAHQYLYFCMLITLGLLSSPLLYIAYLTRNDQNCFTFEH